MLVGQLAYMMNSIREACPITLLTFSRGRTAQLLYPTSDAFYRQSKQLCTLLC